jgi:hypothetical protein
LQAPVKTTVRAYDQETVKLQVQPGQVVVWTFSTVDYDIGFCAKLNDVEKVPYTRYRSHEKQVVSSFDRV